MDSDYDKRIEEFKSKIKCYPDFPIKGILFWDIFSAISDGATCQLLQGLLAETVRTKFPDIEAIVGLESRGFLFAFSLAAQLNVGCLPVRKKGKLPGDVVSYKYDLEYGSDILEIQRDSIRPGLKCLIVDDLIATGGSMSAAVSLLKSSAAEVSGCLVVMELESLNGRKNIPQVALLKLAAAVGPLPFYEEYRSAVTPPANHLDQSKLCGCPPTEEFCSGHDHKTYHSMCEFKCANPGVIGWSVLNFGPCPLRSTG